MEHGFSDLFPNGGSYSDNGHMPLYPLYLAVLFRLLGFKLWVAHFSVLPFLLGALWQLKKLSARYLGEAHVWKVLLFTLFVPAFITQSIYFSQELALVFFSLWLVNAVLEERSSHMALAAMALCLFNLRGISLCGVLLLYYAVYKKQKNAWYLACGIFAWLAGVWLHYRATGWFFVGEEIREFRAFAGFAGMLKNAAVCLWKMLDQGAVFGWVAVGVIAFRNKKVSEPLVLLLLVLISVAGPCVLFTNPIGNRYFSLCYVLLLPAFFYALGLLQKKLSTLVAICFAVVLVSNNGVTYPNRYGNAWDCSLKSLPYFDLRKQLDEYVTKEQIPVKDVSAGFQLYFNDRYYLMNGQNRGYALLSDTEMPTTLYVADSDICNNYNAQREQFLEEHYMLLQTFCSGAVYINLYKHR